MKVSHYYVKAREGLNGGGRDVKHFWQKQHDSVKELGMLMKRLFIVIKHLCVSATVISAKS